MIRLGRCRAALALLAVAWTSACAPIPRFDVAPAPSVGPWGTFRLSDNNAISKFEAMLLIRRVYQSAQPQSANVTVTSFYPFNADEYLLVDNYLNFVSGLPADERRAHIEPLFLAAQLLTRSAAGHFSRMRDARDVTAKHRDIYKTIQDGVNGIGDGNCIKYCTPIRSGFFSGGYSCETPKARACVKRWQQSRARSSAAFDPLNFTQTVDKMSNILDTGWSVNRISPFRRNLPSKTTLVLVISRPSAIFTLAVNQTRMTFFRSPLSPSDLARKVSMLRCSSDFSIDPGCEDQRKKRGSGVRIAYEIYRDIFSPAETTAGSDKLAFMFTGDLERLPPAILVTKPPKATLPFNQISWLGIERDLHWLTTLQDLVPLDGRPTAPARNRYVGIGDAVFNRSLPGGPPSSTCATGPEPIAAAETPSIQSSGQVVYESKPASLSVLARIPFTRNEVCATSQFLGDAAERQVLLGYEASESRLKSAISAGERSNFDNSSHCDTCCYGAKING